MLMMGLGRGSGGQILGQWNSKWSTSKSQCRDNKPALTYPNNTFPFIKLTIVYFDPESKIQRLQMAAPLFTISILV